MAAPTPGSPPTPMGTRLDDGYQTLVSFAGSGTGTGTGNLSVGLWMKGVTPPGLDGEDAVDITTMLNTTFRTRNPRALVTLTEFTFRSAYDPAVYDDLIDILNVQTTVTVFFPNGSNLAFYGFLQSFEPDELVEGTQPEATVTVTPTNKDPATGTEEAPVFTPPA